MPKAETVVGLSEDEIELQIALSRRNSLYARIQTIYEYSKRAPLDEQVRENFLRNCVNLDSLHNDFQSINNKYITYSLKLNPKAKIDDQAWTSFEDLFCHIKYQYTKITSFESSIKPSANNMPKHQTRLPPIELMSFDGDIRTWPCFYASFKATVHENDSLSKAEKLYYLMGKLSTKAQSAFAGTTPCEDNYDLILHSLVERYEDKRMLASCYLNQIFNTGLRRLPLFMT